MHRDIVARKSQQNQYPPPQRRQSELFTLTNKRQKSHKRQSPHQSPYLQIASVPIKERIDPKEVRYVLIILPHNIRAAAGQYTAQEAHAIANATKGWDWSLDENQRPFCLPALEALLDSICKHSAFKGGEA